MYNGNLIKGLTEMVVTVTDTHRTPTSVVIKADNCKHCHAPHGHFIFCPLLNRNVAEAMSALNGSASESDIARAHALGVKL